MFVSLIVLFLTIIFDNVKVYSTKTDLDKIDRVYQEESCSMMGGMCVIALDCPAGHLTAESGLCPAQQNDGVECCYGCSVKETRCRKIGGECKPSSLFCNLRPIYQQATDCPENTRCCILV